MVDAALEPGRVLAGKYRLGERLGEGGMGAVYRAEHLVLQAPVAIKVIEREVADEGNKARFIREAQAAAALRSPHVVQILDYGTEGDFPFMVMELLEGEPLARRIKRKKRLAAAEASWIITHVARAVAKAHELGIVHRDLKPDNVFLVHNEEDEIAKVLDFGVAKIEATSLTGDSHTRTGSLLGTPYYMSPEQAQGNKMVDHRSDLWALGVIAFECLTGRRPFASDGLGDLVLQICIRDIPVPSAVATVPIGFDAWFARAVQREPDQRFQSAKELADALREALGAKDSPSVPDILVTSSSPSAPPASTPTVDEDGRPTALETASVDAAAETVAEELPEGTMAALRHAQQRTAQLNQAGGRRQTAEADEGHPLSISLHGAASQSAARSGPEGEAAAKGPHTPRRRSNAGLFLAVGSGALAVGVLVAVLALRDRPGFRVGDIEGPPTTTTTKRGAGSAPLSARDVDGAEGARQPARPRAQRPAGSAAPGEDEVGEEGERVIDGRSILEPIPEEGETPESKDGDPSGEVPRDGAPTDENPAASEDKSGEPKPPEESSETKPSEPKSGEPKPAETKPSEPKPAETKPSEPKSGEPKAAETKPSEPKAGEPKPPESGEPKGAEPKATAPQPTESQPTEPSAPTSPVPAL